MNAQDLANIIQVVVMIVGVAVITVAIVNGRKDRKAAFRLAAADRYSADERALEDRSASEKQALADRRHAREQMQQNFRLQQSLQLASLQHDVWGTMLDSVYLHAKSRDQLSEPLGPVLLGQVEQAATPTTASGRCVANRTSSPPPSSCAGSPWIVAPGWRGCTVRPITPGSGTPSRRRSTRTSAATVSTTAVCSSSPTAPRTSMPRCSLSRSYASARQ